MKTTGDIALEGLKDDDLKPASSHLKNLTKLSQEYVEYDIELPEVGGVSNKPRVHIGGDVCVSCEG